MNVLQQRFKEQALHWAAQYEVCMLLDNNSAQNACGLHDIEFVMAAGVKRELSCSTGQAFESLKDFLQDAEQTVFGYFTYDLKNEVEALDSAHPDRLQFPHLYFFEPLHVIRIGADGQLSGDQQVIDEIRNMQLPLPSPFKPVVLKERVSKENYLSNVEHIRQHIIEGDVYELNYCVEFYAEQAQIDPTAIYSRLMQRSPVPFASFFKHHDQYLLCASPERFLKKATDKLYSQPIKGTAKRGATVPEDEELKQSLLHSEKERAENLMIVDLVRNDLARSSKTGSVQVDELFGIYSFPQVHQMISTVSSTMHDHVHPVNAIKHAFPMGSMTGAPKIMAMKLIEQYETSRRGLYSGAVGYITPGGDFDLNVVIRSIQYHAGEQYLSFEVGSAVTFDSNPEQEYEECLLKAKAMREVLAVGY